MTRMKDKQGSKEKNDTEGTIYRYSLEGSKNT